MTDILISTAVTGNQDPNNGFNVYVLGTGAIFNRNQIGITLDGNNSALIAGNVYSDAVGIAALGSSIRIFIDTSGVVRSGLGVAIDGTGATNTLIQNFGTISAGSVIALQLGAGLDVMQNSGLIRGDVLMGAGNDSFTSLGGEVNGLIDGGEGNDLLQIDWQKAALNPIRFDGNLGVDTVSGKNFGSALWIDLDYNGVEVWTRDDQNLTSGVWRAIANLAGVEKLIGSAGSDYLSGDNNDNTFVLTHGVDTILGDGGNDTFDASTFESAIWVDLTYTGHEVFTRDSELLTNIPNPWREIAHLTSIENIVMSPFSDQAYGTAGNNVFFGYRMLAGKDTIDGRGGEDTISFATSDVAQLFGAVVIDLQSTGTQVWTQLSQQIYLNSSWFDVASLTSVENAVGTAYGDAIWGDGGANKLEGGPGADTLTGRGGADTFVFNLAADQLQTSAERDEIKDFVLGTDKIGISGTGALPALSIEPNATTHGPLPVVLYDTNTGIMSYDIDGSGALVAIAIAHLVGTPQLTAGDFVFV